jgi:hypothetical protein
MCSETCLISFTFYFPYSNSIRTIQKGDIHWPTWHRMVYTLISDEFKKVTMHYDYDFRHIHQMNIQRKYLSKIPRIGYDSKFSDNMKLLKYLSWYTCNHFIYQQSNTKSLLDSWQSWCDVTQSEPQGKLYQPPTKSFNV